MTRIHKLAWGFTIAVIGQVFFLYIRSMIGAPCPAWWAIPYFGILVGWAVVVWLDGEESRRNYEMRHHQTE